MNKYKSDDYKLGAVKYYLKHNDSMDKVCEIFDCKKSTLKGWIDLFVFYRKELFRKLKFGKYINIKRNEQKMISNFRKIYGNPEEVVICIGDWNNIFNNIEINEIMKHNNYNDLEKYIIKL